MREGGSGLSAGERQLISIARALLADPRILILDEATSNIDRPTEVLIERALDRLLHGRTSIIIAHRLSTVRRADEIVVIERGRIVQRGTESELLGEDGPFRRLAHDLSGGDGGEPPVRLQSLRAVADDGSATSTTSASNCEPAPSRRRRTASGWLSRLRYGRSVVIAWYASQTKMMRDSSGMSSPETRPGSRRRPTARGSGGRSRRLPGAGRSGAMIRSPSSGCVSMIARSSAVEATRLGEDLARDADLADVVQERAQLEPLEPALVRDRARDRHWKARSVIQRACDDVYSSFASSAFASASTVETKLRSRPS